MKQKPTKGRKEEEIRPDIIIRLDAQLTQSLLEGKKLVYQQGDQRTVIIPANHGVFVAMEKWQELKMRLMQVLPPHIAMSVLLDDIGIEVEPHNPRKKV